MEEQQAKVVPKGWIITFVALLSTGILLDIALAAAGPWVISEDSYYSFEGAFQTLTKANGEFFENVEGQTYSDLREAVCSRLATAEGNHVRRYDALCILFSGLESSFVGVLVGICLGILWTGGSIIVILATRRKSTGLVYVIAFPLLSLFTHVGITVSYIVTNSIVFLDSCEILLGDRLPKNLCAGVGTHLLLYGMLYHASLMVMIILVMCIFKGNPMPIPPAPMPQADTSAIIVGAAPAVNKLGELQEAPVEYQYPELVLGCYPPLKQGSEFPAINDPNHLAETGRSVQDSSAYSGASQVPLNVPDRLVPNQPLEEILRSESSDEDF